MYCQSVDMFFVCCLSFDIFCVVNLLFVEDFMYFVYIFLFCMMCIIMSVLGVFCACDSQ